MVERLEGGETVGGVAAGLGLSTTTVRRWWGRYQQAGLAGLENRSSRPHRSPRALSRSRRRQIAGRRLWGWSSLRIARDLRLPLPTVVHVQRRLGLARRPRPAPPPIRRYERARPGELVHLDIKQLARIRRVGHRIHGQPGRSVRGAGWEYLHVAIDDHTRLAYAALFPDQSAASCAAFLHRAARWFARRGITIERILTDNGGGFRGQALAAVLAAAGIRHRWTRPYRPQTIGKAERFIRTCVEEWAYARAYQTSRQRASALGPYLRYYNRERFHMGIKGQTPQQRLMAFREQRLH
jgi:transposase InsO family protein